MSNSKSCVAVLIDGDNVSHQHIADILAKVATYGVASVRRIYGDFSRDAFKGWNECLGRHSIIAAHQPALWTFFTGLAMRIREQGVAVYGFGERRTNHAFKTACDEFTYFDVLSDEESGDSNPTSSNIDAIVPQLSESCTVACNQSQKKPIDDAARNSIRLAIENAPKSDEGWINLARVGDYMSRIQSDMHPRNYGYKAGGLRKFVEASGMVDVRINSSEVCIRLKEEHNEVSGKRQDNKSSKGQNRKSDKEEEVKSLVPVQQETKKGNQSRDK